MEEQCAQEMLSRLHGISETWRLDRLKIGRERGRGRNILGRGRHKQRSGGRDEHDVGQSWFLRAGKFSGALSLESSYYAEIPIDKARETDKDCALRQEYGLP